jgi:predicted  nucleic acid-binding Zn-ribbon protein
MLTHNDIKQIKNLVDDRVDPLEEKFDRMANNIDKILKIVSDDRQELAITKNKVDSHHKRLQKVEVKIGITPFKSSVFA